jgi:hypothetical protein
MNCRVCGNPLFAGRATFRCSCGAITHGYCWEKHVLESHEPEFVVGTVDLDGEFIVNEPEVQEPELQEPEALKAGAEVAGEAESGEEGGADDEATPVEVAEGEEEQE